MITRATAMPWRSAAAGHGLQQRRRALAFRGAAPSLPPPPPPLPLAGVGGGGGLRCLLRASARAPRGRTGGWRALRGREESRVEAG